MKVNFTIELYGHTISSSTEIDPYDIDDVQDEDKNDFIYEHITNEINNKMQIYIEE